MDEEEEVLRQIVIQSIRFKGLGRLHTLKSMVTLGRGWHESGEVDQEMKKYKVKTNYVFEIARRYPILVEVDRDRRVQLSVEYQR